MSIRDRRGSVLLSVWPSRRAVVLAVVAVVGLLPILAGAQEDPYGRDLTDGYRDETGVFSLRTGLGFTADPDSFLMGFEGDYVFSDPFSTGLLLQLAVDDDQTIVSPVAYLRYRADLSGISPDLEKVEPFLQGGVGFTYWDVDHKGRHRNEDDLEFLMNFGFGVEYRFTRHISAGTLMLFNIVPSEIFDERFYFSWEVATVRYRF